MTSYLFSNSAIKAVIRLFCQELSSSFSNQQEYSKCLDLGNFPFLISCNLIGQFFSIVYTAVVVTWSQKFTVNFGVFSNSKKEKWYLKLLF